MDESSASDSDDGRKDEAGVDRDKTRRDGADHNVGETPAPAGRPNVAVPPPPGGQNSMQRRRHRSATLDMDEEASHGGGRHRKQWGWRPEVTPGSDPSMGLLYYPVIRPQRTYGRRQAAADQVRPPGTACQLAPAPPMDRYAGLRPEPAMANGYFTVRQPARTYERQRPTSLVLRQDPVTRSLELRPECSAFARQGVPAYATSSGQDFRGKAREPDFSAMKSGQRELILRHPMGFKARAKAEFAGMAPDAPAKSRTPSWNPDHSAQADFRTATTLYLSSQLDKVKQDAKNGDKGAFLLLEQIQAFGKHRHQFSKKTLLMCARWKDRSYHSYNCARGTQLFALPTAVTLTKHCAQLGLSS